MLEGAIEVDVQYFQPCVYFLYKDDTLQYIGYSAHVGARISNHQRNGIPLNRVIYKGYDTSREALDVEQQLIHIHKPPYNRTWKEITIQQNFIDEDVKNPIKQKEIAILPEIEINEEPEEDIQYDVELESGKKYTIHKDKALLYGQKLKRPAIEFIHPILRFTYLKAWPELGLPPINGKSVD